MKKFLALILVLVILSASMLSACSTQSATPGGAESESTAADNTDGTEEKTENGGATVPSTKREKLIAAVSDIAEDKKAAKYLLKLLIKSRFRLLLLNKFVLGLMVK